MPYRHVGTLACIAGLHASCRRLMSGKVWQVTPAFNPRGGKSAARRMHAGRMLVRSLEGSF